MLVKIGRLLASKNGAKSLSGIILAVILSVFLTDIFLYLNADLPALFVIGPTASMWPSRLEIFSYEDALVMLYLLESILTILLSVQVNPSLEIAILFPLAFVTAEGL